ncbi:hypothetical protein TSUD_17280 [Trifolium subterraneum]|uniref:PPM-type phosphatase domain-containing protein n=1 Tax=Trifolium subterraneum TaxID=3900 RepID=A0A2Z6M0L8_TRISU|nr:hypothetical protein TSUD_17280 [Trifolium subterraneum]
MGIRDFRIKVKAFRVKFVCLGNRSIRRNHGGSSKPSWMMPISHGHHVVEHDVIKVSIEEKSQRNTEESIPRCKNKANIGDYRTVLCKDGVAYQTNGRYNQSSKKRWYRRLFSGNASATGTKYAKALELVVGGYWIDSSTEFVILASNGIWEVMRNQEAVNLIRHIDDPQEAAECLAKEALVAILCIPKFLIAVFMVAFMSKEKSDYFSVKHDCNLNWKDCNKLVARILELDLA